MSSLGAQPDQLRCGACNETIPGDLALPRVSRCIRCALQQLSAAPTAVSASTDEQQSIASSMEAWLAAHKINLNIVMARLEALAEADKAQLEPGAGLDSNVTLAFGEPHEIRSPSEQKEDGNERPTSQMLFDSAHTDQRRESAASLAPTRSIPGDRSEQNTSSQVRRLSLSRFHVRSAEEEEQNRGTLQAAAPLYEDKQSASQERAAPQGATFSSSEDTKRDDEDGDVECVVCKESGSESTYKGGVWSMSCSPIHCGHLECLMKWLRPGKRCPVCRQSVTTLRHAVSEMEIPVPEEEDTSVGEDADAQEGAGVVDQQEDEEEEEEEEEDAVQEERHETQQDATFVPSTSAWRIASHATPRITRSRAAAAASSGHPPLERAEERCGLGNAAQGSDRGLAEETGADLEIGLHEPKRRNSVRKRKHVADDSEEAGEEEEEEEEEKEPSHRVQGRGWERQRKKRTQGDYDELDEEKEHSNEEQNENKENKDEQEGPFQDSDMQQEPSVHTPNEGGRTRVRAYSAGGAVVAETAAPSSSAKGPEGQDAARVRASDPDAAASSNRAHARKRMRESDRHSNSPPPAGELQREPRRVERSVTRRNPSPERTATVSIEEEEEEEEEEASEEVEQLSSHEGEMREAQNEPAPAAACAGSEVPDANPSRKKRRLANTDGAEEREGKEEREGEEAELSIKPSQQKRTVEKRKFEEQGVEEGEEQDEEHRTATEETSPAKHSEKKHKRGNAQEEMREEDDAYEEKKDDPESSVRRTLPENAMLDDDVEQEQTTQRVDAAAADDEAHLRPQSSQSIEGNEVDLSGSDPQHYNDQTTGNKESNLLQRLRELLPMYDVKRGRENLHNIVVGVTTGANGLFTERLVPFLKRQKAGASALTGLAKTPERRMKEIQSLLRWGASWDLVDWLWHLHSAETCWAVCKKDWLGKPDLFIGEANRVGWPKEFSVSRYLTLGRLLEKYGEVLLHLFFLDPSLRGSAFLRFWLSKPKGRSQKVSRLESILQTLKEEGALQVFQKAV